MEIIIRKNRKVSIAQLRTTIDQNGTVIGFDDYDPFGNVLPGRSYNAGTPNDLNKFTGVERDTEGNINLDAFGSRLYDSELGRFYGVDRFQHKYPDLNPFQYAANNPIYFIDVNGDSVWVIARQLNTNPKIIGKVGVHTFIKTKSDKTGEVSFIGFTKGEDGKLVKITDGVDENWSEDDYKDVVLIGTPEGKTDEEFITNVSENANELQNAGYDYSAFPRDLSKSGNCNSATSTIIKKSGGDLDIIKNMDPSGVNPGLGKVQEKQLTLMERISKALEKVN